MIGSLANYLACTGLPDHKCSALLLPSSNVFTGSESGNESGSESGNESGSLGMRLGVSLSMSLGMIVSV